MIRIVYFDYHGVLDRRTEQGLTDVLVEAAGRNDHKTNSAAIRQAVDAYSAGQVEPWNFWNRIEEQYGSVAVAQGRHYYLHIHPVRHVWQLLNHLHQTLQTGLFADCALDKKAMLVRAYGLPEFFDHLIFCCDLRMSKEDDAAYRAMQINSLYQPSDILLIDDSVQNIDRARRLGMTSILYQHPDALQRDIHRLTGL